MPPPMAAVEPGTSLEEPAAGTKHMCRKIGPRNYPSAQGQAGMHGHHALFIGTVKPAVTGFYQDQLS